MKQPTSLYTKEFMDLLKDSPYYLDTGDSSDWHWEFPLPKDTPKVVEIVDGTAGEGIPMKEMWRLLSELNNGYELPNEECTTTQEKQ